MLHVNSLKGKVNAKAVEDALAEVESGGSSLIKAYDKTMRMIQRQDEGYRTSHLQRPNYNTHSP
jgi:hypothetical protein